MLDVVVDVGGLSHLFVLITRWTSDVSEAVTRPTTCKGLTSEQ